MTEVKDSTYDEWIRRFPSCPICGVEGAYEFLTNPTYLDKHVTCNICRAKWQLDINREKGTVKLEKAPENIPKSQIDSFFEKQSLDFWEKMATSTKFCKNCGTPNPSKSKFCKKCGARLTAIENCPQCGSSLDKDSEFCPECGLRIKSQNVQLTAQPASYVSRRLPLGLEILIGFGVLGALYFLFSSMMVLYFNSTLLAGSPISGDLTIAGVSWAFLGLYLLTVAWGLWKLKEWSRKALMIQAVLGIIVFFFNQIPGLASLVYSIIILWYINQSHIKLMFQTGPPKPAGIIVNQNDKNSFPTTGIGTAPPPPLVGSRCPSCGKKGKSGERFCKKCGHEL
jgi:hypothetical protein